MDELRGISVCGMILHHALFDITILFGVGSTILYSPAGRLAQMLIAGTFILLAGISSRFSRNNLKRGAICLGCGLILTLVTGLLVPDQIILFGVLHFLGVAMLAYRLLHNFLDKMNPTILFVLCVGMFLATMSLGQGVLWRILFQEVALPANLYQTPVAFLLFAIGIYDPAMGIYSADYFPLIPWLFLFLAGTAIGGPLREGRAPTFLYRSHLPLFSRIGKHSLLIYMVHQPIVYGIVLLLSLVLPR